jgi:chromosome segregation ATPase
MHPSIQALSELTAEELGTRLVRSDTTNLMLTERLAVCESQINTLQAFRNNYEKVWGALTADELVLFVKCERELLEKNPDGFLSKYHDALFCRSAVEAAKADCRNQIDALLKRIRSAEEETSRTRADLEIVPRLLSDQKQQMQIQCERAKFAEEQLEVVQTKLKECDEGWRHAGEENDALRLRIRGLMEENADLRSKSDAKASEADSLRTDPGWTKLAAEHEAGLKSMEAELVSRHRIEVDCVAASLYEQIRALKMGRH